MNSQVNICMYKYYTTQIVANVTYNFNKIVINTIEFTRHVMIYYGSVNFVYSNFSTKIIHINFSYDNKNSS